MIGIETQSRLARHAVIERAIRYFGPEGLKLEIGEQARDSARFTKGRGFVAIAVNTEPNTRRTRVSISGQDYESQITDFIARL